MSAASSASVKVEGKARAKKKVLNDQQREALVEDVSKKYKLLFGNIGENAEMNSRKKMKWMAISNNMNALGETKVDPAELQRRWSKMKSSVKQKLSAEKRERQWAV